MTYIMAGLAAVFAAVLGWLSASVTLKSRLAAGESTIESLKGELASREADLRLERDRSGQLAVANAKLEIEFDRLRDSLSEEETRLEKLRTSFADLSGQALKSSSEQFLHLAGETIGKHVEKINGLVKPMQDTLTRIEHQRTEDQSRLTDQLKELSRSTTGLETALRQPKVRGNWGEIALENAVKLAGMSEYCHDFQQQVHIQTPEGTLIPDMIVNLPGNRTLVIDAKTPLEHFRQALEVTDEEERERLMQAHAQAVRTHIKDLSRKEYERYLPQAPDFAIMFIPGESFFSAALEHDTTLIEDAIRDRVLLATPTTLVAMLKSIAFTWKQQEQEENVRKIAEAGAEVYARLCIFGKHWSAMQKGLNQASQAFDESMGSWNKRLFPAAERLKELAVNMPKEQIEEMDPTHPLTHETPKLAEKASPDGTPKKERLF